MLVVLKIVRSIKWLQVQMVTSTNGYRYKWLQVQMVTVKMVTVKMVINIHGLLDCY